MGSVVGAAIGALLIGLAEQFGLAYAPTYSVVFTFVIMVVALAFRPRGIMGRRRHERRGEGRPHGNAMSASQWRRAMNSAATAAVPASTASMPRVAQAPRRIGPDRHRAEAVLDRAHRRARRAAPPARARRRRALPVRRLAVLHLPDRRAVALYRPDRALADLPRRLRRHRVAGADDGRRLAGYLVAIFGTSSVAAVSLGWPSPLAVVVALTGATLFAAASAGCRSRRRHLHDHDHARDRCRVLLSRAAELHHLQRLRRVSARSPRRRSWAST